MKQKNSDNGEKVALPISKKKKNKKKQLETSHFDARIVLKYMFVSNKVSSLHRWSR